MQYARQNDIYLGNDATKPRGLHCLSFIKYGSTVDKDSILGEIAFKRSESYTYVPRIASTQYVIKYINMASIQEVIHEAPPIKTFLYITDAPRLNYNKLHYFILRSSVVPV